ncbi:MAG: hypothetical protein JW969_09475 [Spirochaetales bacterium]|nr:hypothetical protein [Spirochaetales bacterium]
MPVKNADILTLVAKISDHYVNNLNNRFLRKAFLQMELPQSMWDILDGLNDRETYYKLDGLHYHELYEIIMAGAMFVSKAKKDIRPNLKIILAAGSTTVFSKSGGIENSERALKDAKDKILKDMAISNFDSNLSIFSDLINDLYIKTVEEDKNTHKGRKCVYETIPELKQVGELLI